MVNDLREKEKKAFAFIRNSIIHHGKSPTLREINEITSDSSPRSASLVVDRLIAAGLLKKAGRTFKLVNPTKSVGNSVSTVSVPLVGSVTCGTPVLAEENIETYIPVSTALAKAGSRYFLLRASGNSMDRAGIKDGDIVLVRQQETANKNDRVVALIDDEATVKVFEKTGNVVILRPRSSDSMHKPIVLTDNCRIQGVVVAVIPSDLY